MNFCISLLSVGELGGIENFLIASMFTNINIMIVCHVVYVHVDWRPSVMMHDIPTMCDLLFLVYQRRRVSFC